MLQNTEHDRRLVKVEKLLEAVEDVARVYLLLNCFKKGRQLSDGQKMKNLRNKTDMGV